MSWSAAVKVPKKRADQLLTELGLAETRTKAQALILAGAVFICDKRVDKPGDQLPEDAALQVRGKPHPYVSRGGLKLAHALEFFALSPAGLICLDVGASTGGFTDVLLQKGAGKVYAVDSGRAQLAEKLRQDMRVISLEKTNARHLSCADIPEPVSFITIDVSFIGLEIILPPVLALAAPGATLVALIKPQFEVGKDQVGKKGVVRAPELHEEVCARIAHFVDRQPEWAVLGMCESPITGPEGNREFLLGARRGR